MAQLSAAKLSSEIRELLKNAELSSMSSKKVREQLEEKLGIDLSDRKREVDTLVMKIVSEKEEEDSGKDDEEGSESEDENENAGSEDEEEESESDDESKGKKKTASGSSKRTRGRPPSSGKAKSAKTNSTSSPKAKKAAAGGTKNKKNNIYTRECTLSSELADVVGQEKMARCEVVKKMWQIFKERELLDPKNKQFVNCDKQLEKLFKAKRFKAFTMMKTLKDHIYDEK